MKHRKILYLLTLSFLLFTIFSACSSEEKSDKTNDSTVSKDNTSKDNISELENNYIYVGENKILNTKNSVDEYMLKLDDNIIKENDSTIYLDFYEFGDKKFLDVDEEINVNSETLKLTGATKISDSDEYLLVYETLK